MHISDFAKSCQNFEDDKSFNCFISKSEVTVKVMSEEEQEQKKKKKKQLTVLETEKVESELLPELVEALAELEKEKKYVDIQVCPKCKSPLVRRVGSMVGDMSAHMGFTPPKYECRECGWREKTVLKATNKPTTVREVVIMAEAKDADIERKRKEKKQ
jgi:hypothetical protein